MRTKAMWARLSLFAPIFMMVMLVSPTAAQDIKAGERVFIKCRVCHQIGENAKSTIAPHLNGIINRVSGTLPDYEKFSTPMREKAVKWTDETLAQYLRNPREMIPRNSMLFPGLKKETDITNIIAYLKQFNQHGQKVSVN